MTQKYWWAAVGALMIIALVSMLPASIFKPSFKQDHSSETMIKEVPVVFSGIPKVMVLQKNEVPQGLHLLSTSAVHTSYVGTPDHPTIDGGMLNTTDGLPITQDNSEKVVVEKSETMQAEPHASTIVTKITGDDWTTSKRVKHLLVNAVKEGKLDYVLRKSEAMGLPASVAVVPMLESNYQSNAVSSKGAAGAWQLMPSVAKDYGISNEERQQFTKSTDTALQLLMTLHQQFGNWEYTFAAYNAGATRVQNAITKNPKATSVEELDLPLETKQYVKRLMGLNKTMMMWPEVSSVA